MASPLHPQLTLRAAKLLSPSQGLCSPLLARPVSRGRDGLKLCQPQERKPQHSKSRMNLTYRTSILGPSWLCHMETLTCHKATSSSQAGAQVARWRWQEGLAVFWSTWDMIPIQQQHPIRKRFRSDKSAASLSNSHTETEGRHLDTAQGAKQKHLALATNPNLWHPP